VQQMPGRDAYLDGLLAFSVDQVDRIASLDADVAKIEKSNGTVLRFYRRRDDTGAVLAWSLCETAP
jgi:hypothetical protein